MSTKNPETKTKILAAALKLLKEKGGKGVRMNDIAIAADVSRQAVYLHFESRSNLMVATVQYADQTNDAATQTEAWVNAEGKQKLEAWIEFWGNYIPQIYGVAKALMVARETDQAAADAWNDRMRDVKKSCRKTVDSLVRQGQLTSHWNPKTASDVLWATLSIQNWELYTQTCGWTNKQYVKNMKGLTHLLLVK